MLDLHKIAAQFICVTCCAISLLAAIWHFFCGDIPTFLWALGFVGISMTAGIFIEIITENEG